jgi:DNA-binding NtrC family response regulator
MASVLIIDDNRAKAAFLKMSLVRERHQVRRSQDIREAIFPRGGATPDLVLINQAMQDFTGWELFNYLKQLAPDLPAMVYVMESNGIDATEWICRAVEAVDEKTKAPPALPGASLTMSGPSAMEHISIEENRSQREKGNDRSRSLR